MAICLTFIYTLVYLLKYAQMHSLQMFRQLQIHQSIVALTVTNACINAKGVNIANIIMMMGSLEA